MVLKVARAAHPKLRYTAGRLAGRVGKDLLLDTLTPSPRNTPVVAKSTR